MAGSRSAANRFEPGGLLITNSHGERLPRRFDSGVFLSQRAIVFQMMKLTDQHELTSQPTDGGPPEGGDGVSSLGPADFRRIGLQPRETRLSVIRRAASKAASSLAARQLDQPHPLTEQQLSRVALSTYRLLDPRQRDDRQSRAHVGRIRAGALQWAGRTEFATGAADLLPTGRSSGSEPWTVAIDPGEAVCEPAEEKILIRSADWHRMVDSPVLGVCDILVSTSRTVPTNSSRWRGWATRPSLLWMMILLLLITSALVWHWGQRSQSPPSGFVPHTTR